MDKNVDLKGAVKHLAIIMDGNGRWAKKRELPRTEGHREGAKTVRRVLNLMEKYGIEYLTLYAFSTENWKRPKTEVTALMGLLKEFLELNRSTLMEKDVKLKVIGRINDIPLLPRKVLQSVIEQTKNNKNGELILALSYGGRTEIVDAAKRIAEDVKKGNLKSSKIDEDLFSDYLYTSGIPADDFPLPMEVTPIRSFVMEQIELSRMINLISYAVSQDDTRKALSGVLFSISENNFTSVATDGRRLALVEKTMDDFSGEDGNIILPIKSATELCKLLSKENSVKVEIGENIINFVMDSGVIMTSKLIDENYPNYKQVIPVSFSRKIDIPRDIFTSILKRISLVVSEKSFFVKLKFANNKIEFNALSTDVGEGNDFLDIEYDGPEIAVSFNPVFLLEPLTRMDCDTVVLKMNEGYSPVALSNEDGFLYVIMPMRKK